MLLQRGEIVGGKKDMIRPFDLETRARAFDHTRIEAQATSRQQPVGAGQVFNDLGKQMLLLLRAQNRSNPQGIGQQDDGLGKTDAIRVFIGLQGGPSHQHAQGIMGQQQGREFLPDGRQALAGQGVPSNALMLFDLVDDQLDLPALVVEQDQVQGRILLGVHQSGHQAVNLLDGRIGRASRMLAVRRGHLFQLVSGLWMEPRGNDPHGQGGMQFGILFGSQCDQQTAIVQASARSQQAIARQASQDVGVGLQQGLKQAGAEKAAIQQDQHPLLERAQQAPCQPTLPNPAHSWNSIHDGMGANLDQQDLRQVALVAIERRQVVELPTPRLLVQERTSDGVQAVSLLSPADDGCLFRRGSCAGAVWSQHRGESVVPGEASTAALCPCL